VHCADLLDALLGESAATVRAVSNRILHADRGVAVETGGLVTVTYPSGVIATIDCSWSVPDSAPTWGGLTLQIVGTKGTMTIAPFAQHIDGYDANGPVFTPVGDDLDGAMLEEFLCAVRDRRQPQPDADVGMRTLAIVDAARRSAETGQPVDVA
jgi:predicted dehydrogenase